MRTSNITFFLFSGLLLISSSLAYTPVIAFSLLPIFFIFLAGSKIEKKVLIFLPFLLVYLISLLIVELSRVQLIFNNDDFVYYYNYFLDFIKPANDTISYGGGGVVEPGLQALNYVLAIFIGENPYIYKAAHVILQSILLCLCVLSIKKYHQLSKEHFLLLFTLMLVFYEYGYSFHILRQGYASFFIVLAVFSQSKSSKTTFFVIAVLFHVTSIIVFPLVNFILKNNNPVLRRRFMLLLFIFSCFFIILLNFLSSISYSNIFIMKLLVAYNKFEGVENVLLLAAKNNFSFLLLFIFVLFVNVFIYKGVDYKNLIPIIVFIFYLGTVSII
ncbi:membrane hypothetical protein [Vibrio chagasii]|nr:membrane hypothetical protein [Vibrio chagasii]